MSNMIHKPFLLVFLLALPIRALACAYDTELLGRARAEMASERYAQAIELSERVLLCRGDMFALTEADIRRMRIRGFYQQYHQQKASVDLESPNPLRLLVDGLREYRLLKNLSAKGEFQLKHHELRAIEQELVEMSSDLFSETVRVRDNHGIEVALPYVEDLVGFISSLNTSNSVLDAQLAESASIVGQYYLDRAEPELAEQYLAKAFRLAHPIEDFSAAGIENRIPIAPKLASAMLYNLAGIYHEQLVNVEPLSASQRSALKHAHRTKRWVLAAKVEGLYKLSFRLNPDNKAAQQAIDSLQGFSH